MLTAENKNPYPKSKNPFRSKNFYKGYTFRVQVY